MTGSVPGAAASIADADYQAAGAAVGARAEALADAAIILAVQAPNPGSLAGATAGALLAGILNPLGSRDRIAAGGDPTAVVAAARETFGALAAWCRAEALVSRPRSPAR